MRCSNHQKPNIVKKHKIVLQLQKGSNSSHQLRLFIKTSKLHQVWVFSFLLWCGTSLVWKCYVTPQIGNHYGIYPQTNKEPISPPVCMSTRSGGGQVGCVFLIWSRLRIVDEFMVPGDAFVQTGWRNVSRTHASPASSATLDSSSVSPSHHQKPWRLASSDLSFPSQPSHTTHNLEIGSRCGPQDSSE